MPDSTPVTGYYVDGLVGSDSGNGSSSAPWKTFAKVVTSVFALGLGTRDIPINLANDLLESINSTDALPSGVIIQQWVGRTAYRFRGGVARTGWTNSSGNIWVMSPGAGLSIKSVVVDWDTNVDASARHYGHLAPAANEAGLSTANTWFYGTVSSVPNTLAINVGFNPNSHVIESCTGGVSGLMFTNNLSNALITDFSACLWVDSTAGTGYGILINGQFNTVGLKRLDDCGFHGAGYTVNGLPCTSNVFFGGTISGLGTNSSALVFYSDTDGGGNNFASNVYIWCHTHLNLAGTGPVVAGRNVGGCFSHNGATNGRSVVIWTNIRCNYWTHEAGNAFDAASTVTPSLAREENYNNYSTKFIQCSLFNGEHITLTNSCSFYRCHFEVNTHNSVFEAFFALGEGTEDGSTTLTTTSTCFQFCEFIHTVSAAPGTFDTTFFCNTNCRLIALNCSFVSNSTTDYRAIVNGTGGARGSNQIYKFKDCIFSFVTAVGSISTITWSDNDASFDGAAGHTFEGNSYFGHNLVSLNSRLRSTNTTWDGSKIETGGLAIYANASPFLSPTTNSSLKLATTTYTTKRTVTAPRSSMQGINGMPYDGGLGAYQNGTLGNPVALLLLLGDSTCRIPQP